MVTPQKATTFQVLPLSKYVKNLSLTEPKAPSFDTNHLVPLFHQRPLFSSHSLFTTLQTSSQATRILLLSSSIMPFAGESMLLIHRIILFFGSSIFLFCKDLAIFENLNSLSHLAVFLDAYLLRPAALDQFRPHPLPDIARIFPHQKNLALPVQSP